MKHGKMEDGKSMGSKSSTDPKTLKGIDTPRKHDVAMKPKPSGSAGNNRSKG